MDPAIAGETAGRLWGYTHRLRRIQQREITPAAVEWYLRVFRSQDTDRTAVGRAQFIDAFRSGVSYWGKVEKPRDGSEVVSGAATQRRTEASQKAEA